MTVKTPASPGPQSALLQRTWIDCFRSVLGQVAGFPVAVEPSGGEEPATLESAEDKPPVCVVFTVSKAIRGDMAILTSETGALALAQVLISEPPDPAAPFDRDRRDAYEELLRQVLGQVATSLKQAAGGEVEIKPSGTNEPAGGGLYLQPAEKWIDASRLGIRIKSEKFEPIQLTLIVSPELAKSFQPPPEVKAPPAQKTEQALPAQAEPSAARGSNLELLLDVKLDATIRFGQKQMLLRDILELHPGTAIALDRQVEEPVELLVGGRVVAHGEVVIVDGNYGLRITAIASPQQRIESLRKSG